MESTKTGERGSSAASVRKKDKEKEAERPFAKYIQEMEELIEYVEREFQREPVHIELSD